MSAYTPLIEAIAAQVHAAYVADKRAEGVVSLPSRRGTGDLMRPYEQLDERDRYDDRRTVAVVLHARRRLPVQQVLDLLVALQSDADLEAELRAMFEQADPPSGDLAERCARLIAGGDGRP